jgi:a disintegrin and metalloproteinase with thrombospondin motifs 18
LYDRPRQLDSANDLDAWKYSGYPGLSYSAKDQCEILLRDHDAYEFVKGDFSQVCENLHCRTPNRPGFFFAGPALPGTFCGNGKWCNGGKCEFKKHISASTSTTKRPKQTQEICKSECLKYGKGVQKTKHHAEIDSVTVNICDDSRICKARKTVVAYGTQKCKEFSKKVPGIDGI